MNLMRKNLPRIDNCDNPELHPVTTFALLIVAGFCAFIALCALSLTPLIVTGGALLLGSYSIYHSLLAPQVSTAHNTLIHQSYQRAKNAKQLAKAPNLKGDPNVKETVKVLWEDHRHLLKEAAHIYREKKQGLTSSTKNVEDLEAGMDQAYQALRDLADERRAARSVENRTTSKDTARILREEVISSQNLRRTLHD